MNVSMRKKVVQQDLSAFSWLLLLFSFFVDLCILFSSSHGLLSGESGIN